MKKIRALVLAAILTVILSFSLCGCVSSLPSTSDWAIDPYFVITGMDVEITVRDDMKTDVRELVTVNFNTARRGIIRDLPTHSGESYQNISARIVGRGSPSSEEINGADKYFVTTEDRFICINMGTKDTEPDITHFGLITYEFKYTVIPPKAISKTDRFYMNVFGTGWAASASDINITVNLPYAVTDYTVYYGRVGSPAKIQGDRDNPSAQSDIGISALLDGKKMEIKAESLEAYTGLTLDCLMTAKAGGYINPWFIFAAIAGVALIVAAILLLMLKKKPVIVQPVSFYPPEIDGAKVNPAEAGLLIDGKVDPSDITPMIFYWASQGNLQIVNEGTDKEQEKAKNLTLVKLLDLPENTQQYEKNLFNGLFSGGNRVSVKSLTNRYYLHIDKAKTAIVAKYRGKLYADGARKLSIGVAAAAAGVAGLFCFIMGIMLSTTYLNFWGFATVAPAAVMYIIGRGILYERHKTEKSKRVSKFLVSSLIGLAVGTICVYIMPSTVPLSVRIILVAAVVITSLIAPFLNTHTEWYADTVGKLSGFKNFLISAEKSRLEALLADDPQYYYGILPYAQVLGVSQIWQDKFKDLELIPPRYYYSPTSTVFSFVLFSSIYSNMYTRVNTSAISRPSSSGGSGGGGGGFGGGRSGGGFGGGGGRSR